MNSPDSLEIRGGLESSFRNASASVISVSTMALDFEMTSRSPSLLNHSSLNGGATIHEAIRSNNHDLLQELLVQFDRDVEAPEAGPFDKRPLHVAAEVNNIKATLLLIDCKANPLASQTCFHGMKPVHIAAARGSVDVLEYCLRDLVSYGNRKFVDLADKRGATPLHWAVQRNQVACARLLIGCGASIRQSQNTFGMGILHIASGHGSLNLLKMVEEMEPEKFRHDINSQDLEGCIPLHQAALLDQPDLIDFLVDKGSSMYTVDKEGRTPLDLSVSRAAWRSASALFRKGADPFHIDITHHRNAVHHAAIAGSNLTEFKAFVDSLTSNPSLVSQLNVLDYKGLTPLHYAVSNDDHFVVKGLLQLGADLMARTMEEKTALHFAAKKRGSLEMMNILLKHTANSTDALHAVDCQGQTALHIAAENGQQEIVEFLLARGAISTADDFGQTPLHLAAAKNHYSTLKIIVEKHGASLNCVDINGQTALHLAAIKDASRVVALLLSREAISKADDCGRTPLDLAIFHKNESSGLAVVSSRLEGTGLSKACLDRCVKKNCDNVTGETFMTYDFSLLQSLAREDIKNCGLRYKQSPMTILKAMARKKRNDLLSHPVCRTLLERKWIIYGLYCSLLILLSNILFVGILSLVLVRSVEEELRPHLFNMSYTNVAKHQKEDLNDTDFLKMHEFIKEDHPGYDGTALVIGVIFMLLIILLKETVDFASEGRRYFYDWTNYVQLLLFIFCGAFVICLNFDHWSRSVGQLTFQFGAVAVFLAWFNLLRFCRPFGTFGIYSFMFFTIFQTLVQVAFFFFILTAAFTLSFYTIFQTFIYPDDANFYDGDKLDTSELETTHDYLPTSGMRIASLMLGDLEAVERFLTPLLKGMLPYPFLSFILYGLCLIVMPILLSNILMGLAIGDLAAVRKNAVILRLQMQVSLHESLEKLFPLKWLRKIDQKTDSYRFYPGRKLDLATWLARWISGQNSPTTVGESFDQLEEDAVSGTKELNELVQIRRRMQELDGNMADIRQLLIQTLHNLDKPGTQSTDPAKITLV